MRKTPSGDPEAEALAIRALAFVAADDSLVTALMEASGMAPGDLRRIAAQPEFAGFILDFLLAEDRRLLDFAAAEGLVPEAVVRVRARLEGGRA